MRHDIRKEKERPKCQVCGQESARLQYKGRWVGNLCYTNLRRASNTVGFTIPSWYEKAAK